MTVALSSFTAFSNVQATTITLTKPTGLAVGDLLIALLGCRATSGGIDFAAANPTWTQLYTSTWLAGSNITGVLYKIADASDVAASDFTLSTNGGGTVYIIGCLGRVSGQGDEADIQYAINSASITPITSNSLALFLPLSWDNDDDEVTYSLYSIVGGVSPTVTENGQQFYNMGASDVVFSNAFTNAYYPSSADITSYTVTRSVAPDSTVDLLILIPEGATTSSGFFAATNY